MNPQLSKLFIFDSRVGNLNSDSRIGREFSLSRRAAELGIG